MTRADVLEALRSALAVESALRWAYLFGSAARGERFRDVDVAVMPDEGAWRSAVELGALVARLEAVMGMHVDVVDLRAAELPFLGPMLGDRAIALDRAPAERRRWEFDVARRWLDFQPSWKRATAIRRAALRQRAAR